MRSKEGYIDKIEPVHETGEGWCGPASLEIALRALGIEVNQEAIATVFDDIEEGLSWDDMQRIAGAYGCPTFRDWEASYENLAIVFNETSLPIIVAWMSDRDGEPGAHYSVVKHIDAQSIILADPEYEDYVMYSRDSWMKRWYDEETRRAYMVIFPKE